LPSDENIGLISIANLHWPPAPRPL
jgi:hypothetical protein